MHSQDHVSNTYISVKCYEMIWHLFLLFYGTIRYRVKFSTNRHYFCNKLAYISTIFDNLTFLSAELDFSYSKTIFWIIQSQSRSSVAGISISPKLPALFWDYENVRICHLAVWKQVFTSWQRLSGVFPF